MLFRITFFFVWLCSFFIHTVYGNEEYTKIKHSIEGLSELECKKKLFDIVKEKEEKKKNNFNKKILAFEKFAEETKRNSEKINKNTGFNKKY